MILTNCNCGEKVECGCGTLTFDSYNAAATSVLEVGNLVADGECTLDEYVIDWYRDGVHALVTGKGLDPDIEAFHPMTGSAAVPVIGGTYVPVLRYFVIGGVQLFPEPKPCRNWCDVVVDLPTIVVARLNCGVGNISATYQYRLTYSSTDPSSLPSRTIAWDLPSNLGTKYFAVAFYAYNIVDRVEVFLNAESNLLAAWDTGFDTSTNFTLVPPRFRPSTSGSPLKFVVELPEYSDGDFLIIKITPSILTPLVTQTDWILDLKCLDNYVSCDLLSASRRTVDLTNYQWVNNTESCRYELQFPVDPEFPYFTVTSSPYYFHSIYGNLNVGTFNNGLMYRSGHLLHTIAMRFDYQKIAVQQLYTVTNYATRYASVANINLVKSSNVFTWTFSSKDDYDDVYNRYTAAQSSNWWTGFEDDPSSARYYRVWDFRWKERPENCGDNALSPERRLVFHRKSTVTFDDTGGVYTLTITSYTITNEYSSEACNTLVTSINNTILAINSTINAANYDENSLCFEYRMFGYGLGWTGWTYTFLTSKEGGWYVGIRGDNNPCYKVWDNDGIIGWSGVSAIYFFLFYYLVDIDVTIDPDTGDFPRDEFGEYIDDPFENFSVYDNINPTTQIRNSPINRNNLILRVENGAITYPV